MLDNLSGISFELTEIFGPPYGEEWKNNKKFALVTLRSYGFGTAAGEGKILDQTDNMAAVISKNGSTPMDPDLMCRKAGACVIFGIVLGKSFTFEDPELKRLMDVIEQWMAMFGEKELATLNNYPPWVSSLLIPRYKKKVYERTVTYINILLDYIKPHIEEFDPDNPRDVVDGYLKERGVDQFDANKMAGNMLGFTADAVSTLASVLNTAMYFLAKHQNVQRRVQAQLDEVVGSSRKVTTKDRASLPLMDAVMFETFRVLSPVALAPAREIPRDTTLNGYNIPKGSYVMSNLWALHMNPDIYKDPDNYHLEHFLHEDGSVVRSSESLAPFGIGK